MVAALEEPQQRLVPAPIAVEDLVAVALA